MKFSYMGAIWQSAEQLLQYLGAAAGETASGCTSHLLQPPATTAALLRCA